MKGTAAAACIGFAAFAFNALPIKSGAQPENAGGDATMAATTMAPQRQIADDSARDRRIEEGLAKRIPEVAFEAVPLDQLLEWFSEVTGIENVHVQWSRLEEMGVDSETPISAKIKDVTAERILRLFLNEASSHVELQYAILDGVLFISTPDGFQRNLSVEVYYVSDLRPSGWSAHRLPRAGSVPRKIDSENVAVEKPDPSALVDLIRNAIAPETWQANGGRGFIQIYNDMLVVRQSERVHAELTRLLTALREPKSD